LKPCKTENERVACRAWHRDSYSLYVDDADTIGCEHHASTAAHFGATPSLDDLGTFESEIRERLGDAAYEEVCSYVEELKRRQHHGG
jgi:hypothetical protein